MPTSYGSYTANDGSSYSNLTALQAIMKEYYGPQQVKNLVYKRNKWLAMIHKEEDWSGLVVPVPVVYGNPQGASATFLQAQTNQTASQTKRFIMNWTQDYALATITNLVNLASRNDAGAFLKAVQNEMNGALRTAENRLSGGLYRSYTGTLGATTAAGIGAGTVTLSDMMAITQFEVGQVIEASLTDGGARLGTVGYVVAVDRAKGTIGFSTSQGGAITAPASWTNAVLFLRVNGDNATGGGSSLRLNGLADWLPTTAPTAGDNFNGVDRSFDSSRLAGIRWDGSQQTIEEALIDAAALAAREDGTPELALTNHFTFAALEKALGSKVNYVSYEHDEVPGIGFQGIRVHGADAEINLFADRNSPSQRVYLIDPDSWTLGSMKACPHILSELDGMTELRVYNADAIEIRIGSYAILACNAPGHNAVVKTQI
jgi:hypothetical protein